MKKVSTKTDWKKLETMSDNEIDTSDIPELGAAFFEQAELHEPPKQPVTLRLDTDVLEWFRKPGKGYQTRINKLLRMYMQTQQRHVTGP